MAYQKGSLVLFGLSDGASPPVYTNIGGDENAQIQYEDQAGEFTNKSSSDLWTELMDGGTVRRLTINLDLVDIDDASVQTIFDALMGSGNRHIAGQFTLPGLGTITANWHCPNFNYSGVLNEAAKQSLTLVAADAPTYAAT